MKKLGWILLLITTSVAFGQGRYEGGINDPDLKRSENVDLIASPEIEVESASSPKDFEFWHKDGWGFNARFGLLNSSYSNINGALSDGSILWGFGIYQNLKEGRWKINYGLDLIFSKDEDLLPENTRATQFRIEPEYHFLINDRFHVFVGLGIVIADYSIRRVTSETSTAVTFAKFASGTAFGVTADVGTRYAFNNTIAVDLSVGYLQYFDSPQNKIGGLSVLPRLNFNF